jgi:hypothetical protein
MAKIGYLYLRNGQWEDKRILPPAWIDQVSHATVDMKRPAEPDLRYSNAFWLCPTSRSIWRLDIIASSSWFFPELDIVAVTTARDFCPFSKLAGYISGAVKSETALPPDPTGRKSARNGDPQDLGRQTR